MGTIHVAPKIAPNSPKNVLTRRKLFTHNTDYGNLEILLGKNHDFTSRDFTEIFQEISREEAESLLMKTEKNCFVIRPARDRPNGLAFTK